MKKDNLTELLAPNQIREEIAKLAKSELNTTPEDAIKRLQAGEFRGFWLEVLLKNYLWLIECCEDPKPF